MVKRTKTITGLLFTALLTVNLAACNSPFSVKNTNLLASYCEYYADGGLSYYTEYSYECDKYGNITKVEEYKNGSLYSTAETTYAGPGKPIDETVYDLRGTLLNYKEFDQDGILKYESTYEYGQLDEKLEYNKEGLVIRKESTSYDYVIDYAYDEDGNLLSQTNTEYYENGSIKWTLKYTYNSYGDEILKEQTDANGNTRIVSEIKIERDGNSAKTYTYSENGELRYYGEREYDDEDRILFDISYRASDDSFLCSYEYTYDDKGRLIDKKSESAGSYESLYEYADEGYLCKETRIFYRTYSSEPYGNSGYLAEFRNIYFYNADGDVTRMETTISGKLSTYTVYYYESVKPGTLMTYDFRDPGRKLDERAYIVY